MVDACSQYKDACSALFESLTSLKTAKDEEKEPDMNITHDCMYQFSQLKKYNCKAQSQCKRVRDNTHQLKKKLDSTDLILKNLQFEEIYLQREIQKCLHFKSVDEGLCMIPDSEFVASLVGKDVPENPHLHMVHRLEWELGQRKEMQSKLGEWQDVKVKLEKEIGDLKDYMESMRPQLGELLASTTQVQERLGVKIVHRRQQRDMAAWLPQALYNIYSQVTGYTEYSKCGVVVTINGGLEKAKNITTESSDLEEAPEPTRQSKRRSAVNEPSKKRLFRCHPLTVEVVVPCDEGVHAKVLFSYLVKLKVVTVSISLMITTASPWRDKFSVGTDYMSSRELLCALWPGDHGDECPNLAMPALLNKYGLPSKSKIPNSSGRPFLWAQRLGGIASWSPGAKLDTNISRDTVAGFIAAIKQRCLARLSLKYQLRNLLLNKPVKDGAISQPTVLTELTSWKEVSLTSLSSVPFVSRALGSFSEKDSVYEVTVKRGRTTCKGVIGVPLEYPIVPPFTILEITTPLGTTHSLTNKNLRAIELELNIYIEDLANREYLLTKVINKLCLAVDVYVEGLGLEPQIKFFMKKFKGPDNILPYIFNAEKQYFEHR